MPAAVKDLIGGTWQLRDTLPLNGGEEEVRALREALLVSRAQETAAKAAKKVRTALV